MARGQDFERPTAAGYQFGLADVFAWMTLIALLLGAGTALLSRFDRDPAGWEGMGPLIIVVISSVLCVPTGIISVLLTWLVLAHGRRLARWLVAIGLATLWAGFCLYVLVMESPQPFALNPDGYSQLAVPPAMALPALLLLGVARATGWRMERIARRTKRMQQAPAAASAAAGTLP
jgi:hypothetical protein